MFLPILGSLITCTVSESSISPVRGRIAHMKPQHQQTPAMMCTYAGMEPLLAMDHIGLVMVMARSMAMAQRCAIEVHPVQ